MTIIWSHRGHGIENTLSAFQSAWNEGIDHFETDLQVTADDQLILSHDDSMKRLTGKKHFISKLSFSELQRFPISGVEEWATLGELLHSFPDAKISLDMKTNRSLSYLITFLKNNPSFKKRLIVGSFSSNRLQIIRNEFPKLTTALTTKELMRLKLIGKINSHSGQRYAMIPIKYFAINVVNKQLMESLNKMTIPVHVWTINNLDMIEKCLELSVDGIITDHIVLAKSIIRS